MDRVHWPGLGHELGVGVGDSSVAEAHRLSLGKFSSPKDNWDAVTPSGGMNGSSAGRKNWCPHRDVRYFRGQAGVDGSVRCMFHSGGTVNT